MLIPKRGLMSGRRAGRKNKIARNYSQRVRQTLPIAGKLPGRRRRLPIIYVN